MKPDYVDSDEINLDILNGKKYPTDEHLAEEKRKWKKYKEEHGLTF